MLSRFREFPETIAVLYFFFPGFANKFLGWQSKISDITIMSSNKKDSLKFHLNLHVKKKQEPLQRFPEHCSKFC